MREVRESTRLCLLDLEQELLGTALVQQFLQRNSLDELRKSMEIFYQAVLALLGLDREDLYFEEVCLEKIVDYHIEIHFVE